MSDSLKKVAQAIIVLLVLFIMSLCFIPDVFSKDRTERHAKEVKYENCMNQCRNTCGGNK